MIGELIVKSKPKSTSLPVVGRKVRQKSSKKVSAKDRCQSPPQVLSMLPASIMNHDRVYEPACGKRYLAYHLIQMDKKVIIGDKLTGQDYFDSTYTPLAEEYDVQITNPPYSLKYKWMARAYALGKPFALLMPLDSLGSKALQNMIQRHGMLMVLPHGRINFEMPRKSWYGSATFNTAWFIGNVPEIIKGVLTTQLASWTNPTPEETIQLINDNRNALSREYRKTIVFNHIAYARDIRRSRHEMKESSRHEG